MIELTQEQQQAMAQAGEVPPRVIDPSTLAKYVLVREEIYDRVKQVFATDEDSLFTNELTPHVLEVFGREGWNDPAMDIYNDLDPRRGP